ncbi:MAG: hypothetical protein M3068_00290 [Gemmatimonadota bacterium]|nr:hypothetical protein [Gemmatimonadota bacterium]
MNLVREVLDNQLRGREGRKMGRVDGIVLELLPGAPPRVAHIEVGWVALARRLSRRLGQWASAHRRRDSKRRDTYRIPWDKVRKVGLDVVVDVDAERSPALASERWVRDHMIRHIPGS